MPQDQGWEKLMINLLVLATIGYLGISGTISLTSTLLIVISLILGGIYVQLDKDSKNV